MLVNNAGISHKGFFGQMYVARSVLPVMREQRSGHVIAISSGAGFVGFAFSSAYAASKFGTEGWMSALHDEIEPFGIDTTVVDPGSFRTSLTSERSMPVAEPSVDDYNERRAEQIEWWKSRDGQQPNDPTRLADALVEIASEEEPPRRFIAGSDAIELAEQKIADLQEQIDAYRDLSTSMAHDDAQTILKR